MKTATSSTKVMKAVKTKAMPMKKKALQKKLNPMKKTTSPMKVMKAIEMNENIKKQWLVDMSESHDGWLDVSSYNDSFKTKPPCPFKKWIQTCMEERGGSLWKRNLGLRQLDGRSSPESKRLPNSKSCDCEMQNARVSRLALDGSQSSHRACVLQSSNCKCVWRDSCEFVAVCFGRSSMHDLGNCTVRSFETSCGERINNLKFGVLALLKPLPWSQRDLSWFLPIQFLSSLMPFIDSLGWRCSWAFQLAARTATAQRSSTRTAWCLNSYLLFL